jgi:hypothetical protein
MQVWKFSSAIKAIDEAWRRQKKKLNLYKRPPLMKLGEDKKKLKLRILMEDFCSLVCCSNGGNYQGREMSFGILASLGPVNFAC